MKAKGPHNSFQLEPLEPRLLLSGEAFLAGVPPPGVEAEGVAGLIIESPPAETAAGQEVSASTLTYDPFQQINGIFDGLVNDELEADLAKPLPEDGDGGNLLTGSADVFLAAQSSHLHNPQVQKQNVDPLTGLLQGPQRPEGALSGKIVYLSPGHGAFFRSVDANGNPIANPRWDTDREYVTDLQEDLGTQSQASLLADYLFNAGATVVPLRPVGHQTNEVVLDNTNDPVRKADGSVRFNSGEGRAQRVTGAWQDSFSTVYFGDAGELPFQFAFTEANESATFRYTPRIPEPGFYPIYAWSAAGANRAPDQTYRIHHTYGVTEVKVDHRRVGGGYVYLGTYFFEAKASDQSGSVEVSNKSQHLFSDALTIPNHGFRDLDQVIYSVVAGNPILPPAGPLAAGTYRVIFEDQDHFRLAVNDADARARRAIQLQIPAGGGANEHRLVRGALTVNFDPMQALRTVVVADAIRFGNGMGDIPRGAGAGAISGHTREDEEAFYWILAQQGQGTPRNDITRFVNNDNSSNVDSPARWSGHMNRRTTPGGQPETDRLFLAIHSNSGPARGTTGLINPAAATTNQAAWAELVAREVFGDLAAIGSPPLEFPWEHRRFTVSTVRSGEIRNDLIDHEFDTTLLEIGFHDHEKDARVLRDPKGRDAMARAMYHAITKYFLRFGPNADPPDQITIANHGFNNNEPVRYENGGGQDIQGLNNGTTYTVRKVDDNNVILLQANGAPAALTGVRDGHAHRLVRVADGHAVTFDPFELAQLLPDRVSNVHAITNTDGSVTIHWDRPAFRAEGGDQPTGYRVYASIDGHGFDAGRLVPGANSTQLTIRGLKWANGVHYFRVAAINEGGESLPSAVVAARVSVGAAGKILIVNGFDRLDRTQNPFQSFVGILRERVRPQFSNSFDYAIQVAEAIEASSTILSIDTVQNETLALSFVSLLNANNQPAYNAVVWILGEESEKGPTDDATLDPTEQTLLRNYLNRGGNVFISGSDLGFDFARAGAIYIPNHQFTAGQQVTYHVGTAGGTPIGGLVNNTQHNVVRIDDNSLNLGAIIPTGISNDSRHELRLRNPFVFNPANAFDRRNIIDINGSDVQDFLDINHNNRRDFDDLNGNGSKQANEPFTEPLSPPNPNRDTILIPGHGLRNGDMVIYRHGAGGVDIGGLIDGENYFAVRKDNDRIRLARTAADARAGRFIDLIGGAGGNAHEITPGAAFDPSLVTTTASIQFFADTFHAGSVQDDANSHTARGEPNSIFSNIDRLEFDNGSRFYDVDAPDSMVPGLNAVGALVYLDGQGNPAGIAALQHRGQNNVGNLVLLGFPFETIVGATVPLNQQSVAVGPEKARATVMQRVLDFLLTNPLAPALPFGPLGALPQERFADDLLTSLFDLSSSLSTGATALANNSASGQQVGRPLQLAAQRFLPSSNSGMALALLDGLDDVPGNVLIVQETAGLTLFDVGIQKQISGRTNLDVTARQGTLNLFGSVDLVGDLEAQLRIGMDSQGLLLDLRHGNGPELRVRNLKANGAVTGSGRIGLLGVTVTDGDLDTTVNLNIHLREPLNGDADGLYRIEDLDTLINDLIETQIEASPSRDDVTFQADYSVSPTASGEGPLFDLFDASIKLAWADGKEVQDVTIQGTNELGERLLKFLDLDLKGFVEGFVFVADALRQITGVDVLAA